MSSNVFFKHFFGEMLLPCFDAELRILSVLAKQRWKWNELYFNKMSILYMIDRRAMSFVNGNNITVSAIFWFLRT